MSAPSLAASRAPLRHSPLHLTEIPQDIVIPVQGHHSPKAVNCT